MKRLIRIVFSKNELDRLAAEPRLCFKFHLSELTDDIQDIRYLVVVGLNNNFIRGLVVNYCDHQEMSYDYHIAEFED